MFARATVGAVFLKRANFSRRFRRLCQFKANSLTAVYWRVLFRIKNKRAGTKMSANRRIVEILLFASPQIYRVVFFVKNERLFLFRLANRNWLRLIELSCLEAFLHQMPAHVHFVASNAFFVIDIAKVRQKGRRLPRLISNYQICLN